MKKIFLLTATVFCFSNLINAQPGRLDPTFGNNGIVKTDLGKGYAYGTYAVSKILSQSDGSMFVVQKSLTKRHSNGSIDSSFGINGYLTDTSFFMYSAAIQPDGKIVVVGDGNFKDNYPNVLQSDFEVARYYPDGSPDSSFSGDGKQTTDFGAPNANFSFDRAYSVGIQKNGKIVVEGTSGASLAIACYNADGSLNNTFSEDGKLVNDSVYAITLAIQKDNKIVVAGSINADFAVLRYNLDGSLDNTFSGDGIQTTDFASTPDFLGSLAIQSDGKIVAGGSTVIDLSTNTQDFALVRYNIDGSLDKSFSNDGKQTTHFGYNYGIMSLAFQNDGKIVAAGDSAGYAFALARYDVDGSLDKSFSNDGKQTTAFGGNKNGTAAYTVTIQSDGKIVAGGSAYPFLAIARYNRDGSLDNTFDNDGKLSEGFNAGNTIYTSTAFQKDGKIVAAGRTWNGSNFDFAIARYNTDGSLDNTFSSDGVQTTDFASKDDYANGVAIQNDGKMVVVGYSGKSDTSIISVARYNPDGSFDNTFGSNGKLQTDFGLTVNQANSVAIQSNGKIVVVGEASIKDVTGYVNRNLSICRYNTDGSLDKTFDNDGKQTVLIAVPNEEDGGPGSTFTADSHASSVAIQKDGKIVVGGLAYDIDKIGVVVRLNTDGSLDKTFSDDGKTFTFSSAFIFSFSVAIQNDKKIVVGGDYNEGRLSGDKNGNFIKRLNIDGSFDKSFHNQITQLGNSYNNSSTYFGNLMAIQNDGKIVVKGTAFTRYTANGSLDSTFGVNGIQEAPESVRDVFINSIAVSGNKLYGAGSGRAPRNVGLIARYLLDNGNNTAPTVTLTSPADNTIRLAPAAHIKLSAAAADKDGTITKVEFYNGTKLLHTETVFPYGYVWEHVPLGNYTLTAKAYDNSGNVTTSAPVHISVVPNKPPVVSITKPVNNRSFAAPGYIHLEAAASDTDGRVTNVKFYNGSSLLRTEYEYPYTYHWGNVPAGTYTITAVATDNWGAHTTSAPVTIVVTSANAMIVSNRSANGKTPVSGDISLKLYPNPATNAVNVYTQGLQQSKPATISIIGVSGIVLKTLQTNNSTTQLDVSSLAKGVYTIKIVSGDKVMYKQFVKL